MIVLQIIIACGWMCVIPFLTGSIFSGIYLKRKEWNICFVMVTGLMIQYALYEVLALIGIALDESFRLLTKVYAVLAVLLALFGAISLYLKRKELQEAWARRIKLRWDGYLIAALVLIGIQIAAIIFFATPDSDDAFYSGLSSMSLAGDYILKYNAYNGLLNLKISTRYAISALPVYQASLSLLTGGMHHLFITHNLFPVFYMPLAYGVFYQMGKLLVGKDTKKRHSFLFFFALLHLFGNYFVFSPQNFLLTRIWQGKALFVCFIVPFLYLLVDCYYKKESKKEGLFYISMILLTLIAALFMGETGLFLGPLMLIILICTHLIVKKV